MSGRSNNVQIFNVYFRNLLLWVDFDSRGLYRRGFVGWFPNTGRWLDSCYVESIDGADSGTPAGTPALPGRRGGGVRDI